MGQDEKPQGEGFLSRWSRRKQDVAQEQDIPADVTPPEPEALPAEPEPMPELPSLESLLPGQDLSVFMHPAVPQSLRNAALRKMWVMDPAIRDFVSEALDYAYDYNTPGMAPGFGALQTTPDMIREVSEMMDRAMGHHRIETDQVAVLPEGVEKQLETGAVDDGTDPVTDAEAPEQVSTLVLDASQQPGKLPQIVDSSNEKTSMKSDAKPRSVRRHGGALPS